MRRLFYLLCAFVFAACNESDDEIVADVDKPYTKMSSSELTTLLDEKLEVRSQLMEESNAAIGQAVEELSGIAEHYGFEQWLSGSVVAKSDVRKEAGMDAMTGMLLKWNPEKGAFDVSVGAEGCLVEIQAPASLSDASVNDLTVKITTDESNGKSETRAYKQGKLWISEVYEMDREEGRIRQEVECPPYSMKGYAVARKSGNVSGVNAGRLIVVRYDAFSYMKMAYAKEGGASSRTELIFEDIDMTVRLDCDNVRFTGKFVGLSAILPLLEDLYNEGEEGAALMTELLGKNFRENVVVFTDRNEKIADWQFDFENSLKREYKINCTFQDGGEYTGMWRVR